MKHIQHNLFIGSVIDAQDIDDLTKNNITVAVSVSSDCDMFACASCTSRIQIDIENNSSINHKDFEYFYNIVESALKINTNVLVYCITGNNTSMIFAVYYLIRKNNWTKDISHTFLKKMNYAISSKVILYNY